MRRIGRAGSRVEPARLEVGSSAAHANAMRTTILIAASVPQKPGAKLHCPLVQRALHRRIFLCIALTTVLAGCSALGGGDEAPAIPESGLPAIVLQPDDLGGNFTRFDEGRLAIADAPLGERADPERFGRIDGWKARFRRSGSAATVGPLVVESRADLFEGAGGAERELEAHQGELEPQARHPSPATFVELEELGDEAFALTQDAGDSPPGSLVSHTVAWRYRNASASVTANGFAPRLRLADVLALARAQQRRLAAAAPADG